MSIELGLRDCELTLSNGKSEQNGLTLHLALPKMIDLSGIKPYVNWEGVWHNQFVGSSGSLYIACDHHARFWPNEYLYRKQSTDFTDSCNVGNFVSYGRHTRFQEFELANSQALFYGLNAGAEEEAIIGAVNSMPGTQIFFRRFIEWVNEFVHTYGEERFYDPIAEWDKTQSVLPGTGEHYSVALGARKSI